MTSIRENLRRLFEPAKPIPPGTYHYQAPPDDPDDYRLHLRIEAKGNGLLIINAATVLHLNQTAAEYAYYMVQDLPEEQVVKNITSRYRISKEKALSDYRDFFERVDTLIATPDLDPVTYLGFDRTDPFPADISAPYRLDCALTYQIREEAPSGATPVDRVERELDTSEWKAILDKAWAAGIPHVVFTGGEPTLREDLIELVTYAESLGQVTGLMTDGIRFADQDYLQALLKTGLDHITLIFQPELEAEWQTLANLLAEDIFVAVHLTITSENREEFIGLLKRLAEMGVQAVSLSASRPDLSQVLLDVREYEASLDMELVWNLPVPYSLLNPVSLETEGQEQIEGAGRAWMYVEPDGDVLPSQGIQRPLGNFLRDSWEKIWKAE
jgi:organic radical activating enzyme